MDSIVVTCSANTGPRSIFSRRFVQVFSAILLPFSIAAEPVVREYYNYYPVDPESLEDILPSLRAASPIEQDGEVFFGDTDTSVSWQFWWQQQHGRCWIDKVTTAVEVNYTLPELHESTADASVRAIWRKWYPRLVLHERGHSDLALKAAMDIETSILAMDAGSSCEQLEVDANKLGARFIAELQQLDKHYDETTSHGKSQGAQLSSWL